jgi:O-antigen/teichoic acid export membrane protein
MAEQTLKEKTAKGLFWGGISNGVQQVLGVLIGIVLLRNLSPGDYGMVGMLAIFTGIASTIQESGFTAALTNRPEFKAEDYNAVFWFNVFVGSGIYVILFFCAPLIAKFYNQPDLVLLSRVLFLSIVIGALGIAHNAVLFRKLMVKERAKIDIISIVLAGIAGIYLAVNGYGYWALAIQTLVFSSFGTILRWIFSPWHPTLTFNFTPVKEMFGFGFILLLSSFIAQIQSNIFSVLLGRFYTKTDVGYFAQGTKWSSMGAAVINGMIMSVAQPIFVLSSSDRERLVQIFRKIIRFISFVVCPSMLGLAFVSREFISIINKSFLPCVPILQIYCVMCISGSLILLYGQIIIAFGKSTSFLFANIVYAIFQIGVAFITLRYGIYWMAFSIGITSFLYLIIWHWLVSKIIPIRIAYVLKDMFPYFVITLIVLVITYLLTISIANLVILLITKILIAASLYILIMKISNSVIFKEALLFIKNGVR